MRINRSTRWPIRSDRTTNRPTTNLAENSKKGRNDWPAEAMDGGRRGWGCNGGRSQMTVTKTGGVFVVVVVVDRRRRLLVDNRDGSVLDLRWMLMSSSFARRWIIARGAILGSWSARSLVLAPLKNRRCVVKIVVVDDGFGADEFWRCREVTVWTGRWSDTCGWFDGCDSIWSVVVTTVVRRSGGGGGSDSWDGGVVVIFFAGSNGGSQRRMCWRFPSIG